jgi:hypothetical protein
MFGKRIKIIVEVDTDGIPGWGYDPQDYVKLIDKHLQQTIPHYNPEVKLAEEA